MTLTERDRQIAARAVKKLQSIGEQRMRLGMGDTNKTLFVSGRTGFVYARPLVPSTATASQVRCRNVVPAYGLPVIVKPGDDGILEVLRADPRMEDAYAGNTGANFNIAIHAPNHGRYGPDPIFLSSKQYLPLATIPATPASTSVYVNPIWYVDTSGDQQYFAGGNISLSSEIAALTTNQQQLVIIALNRATGALTKTTGAATVFVIDTLYEMPFTTANVQAISVAVNNIKSQAVRIYAGQTTIQLYDMPDDFDLRNWLDIAGGSMSGVPITVLDSEFTLQDDADPTKQFQFQTSGITAGQTRILTVPDYNATLATLAGTETFTNKTLTSPVINTPTISGGTIDNAVIGGTTPAAGTFTALTVSSGGNTQATISSAGATVFNEQGNDADFRVEGDTDNSLLFGDASTNRIGIGLATPQSKFHLVGTADEIQFRIVGVSGQTQPLADIQDGNAASVYGLSAAGVLTVTNRTALTNTFNTAFLLQHNTSGTPAAGFGVRWAIRAESSTTENREQFVITTSWVDATDASRKGRVQFGAFDTAHREGLRIEASGTAPMLGFYGSAAIAKQAVTGSRGGNAALASLLTALATLGLITDSSTA